MEQRIEELESRVADLEQHLSAARSEKGIIGNILGIHRREDSSETDEGIKACVEELFKNDNSALLSGAKKALYREVLKVAIESHTRRRATICERPTPRAPIGVASSDPTTMTHGARWRSSSSSPSCCAWATSVRPTRPKRRRS
jgi:hypothetical protein